MEVKIQLSIEEIVYDFESLIRIDEKLSLSHDYEKSTHEDITERLTTLITKYIPNYTGHLECDRLNSYEDCLEMYKICPYGS